MATRLPLRSFWFSRSCWIDVDLRAPSTVGEPPVLEEEPVIPELPTGSPFGRPTTTLLFETQRRMPPMRWYDLAGGPAAAGAPTPAVDRRVRPAPSSSGS